MPVIKDLKKHLASLPPPPPPAVPSATEEETRLKEEAKRAKAKADQISFRLSLGLGPIAEEEK